MAERKESRSLERSPEAGELERRNRGYGSPFSMVDWMLDRLQRDFFGEPLMGTRRGSGSFERPARVSSEDRDNELRINIELPGIEPANVKIDCRDNVLTVRGESSQEAASETSRAQFFTQLALPADVDVDRAQASFRHGLLTIRFPWQEPGTNVRRIPITEGSAETGAGEREQAA